VYVTVNEQSFNYATKLTKIEIARLLYITSSSTPYWLSH